MFHTSVWRKDWLKSKQKHRNSECHCTAHTTRLVHCETLWLHSKNQRKKDSRPKKRVSRLASTESTIGIQINLAAVSEREKERRRQTVGR